jgi:hypothetical protein
LIRPGADTGSSILEMLVALAILAVAATLLVTASSRPRRPVSDPVTTANGLLLAARTEAILSGQSVIVRLRSDAMDVGDQTHGFPSALRIAPGSADTEIGEVVFAVLADGTRTGGTVLLSSERLREPMALIPHGAGP